MRKTYSPSEAKGKILRYCAYQERCHQEVRIRLFQLGLSENQVDETITDLITEGFLNEERFAKTFAGGKFRIKKWGRLKIIQVLEAKGVTSNCIRSGLKEIDEQDYLATLTAILKSKDEQTEEPNPYVRRDKISKHAIQRGYEPELVWRVLRELLPDQQPGQR